MALAVLKKPAERSVPAGSAEGLSVFPSSLGWMALVTAGDRVLRLSFGHASPHEAAADVSPIGDVSGSPPARVVFRSAKERPFAERKATMESLQSQFQLDDLRAASNGLGSALQRRLQAYAEGAHDDFLDVALDFGPLTQFQERVINRCRRIPPGQTISYGELAEECGYPRAARAVGNCMRTNCIPLLVPCHRVVGAGGEVKGYSASDGVRMKLRLLELEKNGGSATLPISG
jgi:O-6-methylguanine DNA methyltransferase